MEELKPSEPYDNQEPKCQGCKGAIIHHEKDGRAGRREYDCCQVGQQSIKLLSEISEELEQAGSLTRQPQIKGGPEGHPMAQK